VTASSSAASLGNQLDVNENGIDYFFNLTDVDHINVFLTSDNGNDLVIANPLFSGSRALG
jgi:hypothetical protein